MELLNVIQLSDYILLPREERIAHIDLSDPCVCGKRTTRDNQPVFKKLLESFHIENDIPNRAHAKIDICHLCDSPFCHNLNHVYLGSRLENRSDIPSDVQREISQKVHAGRTPEQRSESAKKGHAKRSPEERRETARNAYLAYLDMSTPEQRSESARKREATKTPEQRSKSARMGAEKRQRAVQIIASDGGLFFFESLKSAAEFLCLDLSRLCKVCQGKRKSVKGYTATYWDR